MNKNRTILLHLVLTIAAVMSASLKARTSACNLQLRPRVGYSIGGTAPIGVPATIRSIDGYHLTPSFLAGADVLLQPKLHWGVLAGLHFGNKGMDADITTKAYHMEMRKGADQIEGLFTGHISQQVKQLMLTVPLQLTYSFSPKLMLKAGPYASVLLKRDFSGIASDGYLRQGDPTGAKILIGDRDGEWATYDFSDDMRRLQMGVGIGADWCFYKSVGLSIDLNWGLTGIFSTSFKTVEQTLYPIYGTIAFFYDI